jgi:GWxTD domain-containing protein
MKLLEAWVQTPLAGAAGWALIHSLWEGAIVAAALAAVLAVTRPARVRYGAACVAMLAMLGGFGFTLVRAMPEGGQAVRTVGALGFPALNLLPGMDGAVPAHPAWAAIVPWLAPGWIAGVWTFCLWHVAGWVSVRRLRRRGLCAAPAGWERTLARLRAQLRVSAPVLLLESCLAEVPMVLGHFRPVILLPAGLLAGLPPQQIEAILLHELAHIRRCDYLVNVWQRVVEGLLFYHPAIWWISRVIRDERENCCDDVAVAIGGDAHEYAVALAALEQNRWPGGPAVAATGGNLVKRIRRLLYPKGPAGAWPPLAAALLFAASATVALAAWQLETPKQSVTAAQEEPDGAVNSPYDRWLRQEVVYIIANQERAAFERLTTDAERDKFIEQFWARRNPVPGAAENKFKTEHYRRIAFANQHFGLKDKAGWKTDQGRVYIQWGPPDEIDAYHMGNADTPPHEKWHYSHIKGVGDEVIVRFVDSAATGDYRLAPTATW